MIWFSTTAPNGETDEAVQRHHDEDRGDDLGEIDAAGHVDVARGE